jgi:adenylate cyclase
VSGQHISFIDEERLWFKAKYGLPPDFVGCPREVAFCATTICTELVTFPIGAPMSDSTRIRS